MCGIVGYIGSKNAAKILINGLKRLEYRGYDSSGIALLDGGLVVKKKIGKIANLEENLDYNELSRFHTGIAHTRWATHGVPSDINAHPHTSSNGEIAIVHNGIIENYQVLKRKLIEQGYKFTSDTDSEVVAQLIEYCMKLTSCFLDAVFMAISELEGTYGLVIVSKNEPGRLIAARKGSPLIIGVGDDEVIIASDASAIVEHTKQVLYIDDGEIIDLTRDSYQIYDLDKNQIEKEVSKINWDLTEIEKQGFEHFMLKEIFEQKETVVNAFRGRLLDEEGSVRLDGLNLNRQDIQNVKRIILIACGTSWHAGLIGEYLIEEYARIPVEVEYASEFRYRKPILFKDDLVIVISQSGETADTLAALREAKEKGVRVLGITNVVGSTIARETDGGVYIHAGPEIGVASTKAFTSQVTVLILLTILFARTRDMNREEGQKIISELRRLPELISDVLSSEKEIKMIAESYFKTNNCLYLGRGLHFPVALEGALKLKEISYIHAEGYPAAEMKHGPIALIDENMPVVVIAVKDSVYSKILSNIQEVKARKGRILAIATKNDPEIEKHVDHVIFIPKCNKIVAPLLTVIPLQLLSYHIAVMRGCNVDQPRNLAKSVTVE